MGNPSKKDQVPVPRGQGQPPVGPEKLAAFLEKLALTGNVTQACELAGFATVTAYRYRKEDPDFAAAWEEASTIGARALEDEARRRGFQGWLEPIVYEGKVQTTEEVDAATGDVRRAPAVVRKFSDTLLIFLLKAHFPEKYRDRWVGELTGPGGGPLQSVNLHAVTGLSTEELKLLRGLLARAAAKRGAGA